MQFPLAVTSEAGSVCVLDLYFSALEEVLIPCLILGFARVSGRKVCTDPSTGEYFINQVLTVLLTGLFSHMIVKHIIFAPERCCLQSCMARLHRTGPSSGRVSGVQPVPLRKGAVLPNMQPGSRTDAEIACLLTIFFHLVGLTASDGPSLLVRALANAASCGTISGLAALSLKATIIPSFPQFSV